MTQSLPDALADVRRAYRLLWGYQKRVLNIVAMIREQLGFAPDRVHFEFAGPGQKIADSWMWCALPFSQIGFEGMDGSDPKKIGARHVCIDIISDTALRDEGERLGYEEEPNPDHFPLPEECRSEIDLWIVENARNRRGPVDWPGVLSEIETWTPTSEAYCDDGGGVRIYGERIDLVELGDPTALSERVELFRLNADRKLAALAAS